MKLQGQPVHDMHANSECCVHHMNTCRTFATQSKLVNSGDVLPLFKSLLRKDFVFLVPQLMLFVVPFVAVVVYSCYIRQTAYKQKHAYVRYS